MRLIDADALTAHLLDVWYVDDEVYVGIIIEEISHAQTIEPSMPTLEERKTGDLISRQAAVDAVNEYLRLSEVSKTVQNMTSIQGVLRRLPSAQPDRR